MAASRVVRQRYRILRLIAVAAIALVGLTCRDRSLTGPGIPHRAALNFAPHFAIADGTPTLQLDSVRARVYRIPSADLVLDTMARFAPGASELRLNLSVPITESSEEFRLVLLAYDTGVPAQLIFMADETVTASVAGALTPPVPVALEYVGPDTIVAAVAVAPRDSVLTLGDNFTFRAVAKRADSTVVAASIGWVSRDTNAISIDLNSGLATAKTEGNGIWIVGTSFTGKKDSTRVSITQAVATVAVSPSPATVVTGRTVQLSAAVADAGARPMPTRPVSWRSANTAVATVSSTGLVTGVSIDTTSIFATSGAITDTVKVTVTPPPVFRVLVSPSPDTTIYLGDQFAARVRVEDDLGNELTGRAVLWASLTPAVATVDPVTGVVTGVAAGTATITATSESMQGTMTVNVVAIGSLVLTPAIDTIPVGDSARFNAVATDSTGAAINGRAISWTTLNAAVATVDGNGFVKGVATGTTFVVASTGGRADTSEVLVQPLLDRTVITPRSGLLTSINDSLQHSAQAYIGTTPVTGSFTWVSRDPAVASVTPAGLVVAHANGVAWIVVTEAGGTRDSSRVTVQQQVSSVTVTPSTKTLYVGTTFQLSVTAVDGRGNAMPASTAFAWSSDAAAAAVNASGLVTANAIGTATISATAGGVTGRSTITVLSPVRRITVTPDSLTLASLGLAVRYTATAYDTLDQVMTGVTFTWSSTNPSVAPLDSITATTARAVSFANGVTTIRASAQGTTGFSQLTVQQQLAAIEVTPSAASVAPNGSIALIARGKDANNRYMPPGVVSWSSDSTQYATVNSSGIVTGVAIGTARITATNGVIVSNPSAITVTNAVPPVISFGRDTIAIGRGSSTSIPLFLSTPSASPVTVNLSAADTVAYFSSSTVTFPAGSTAQNVTLNGRNAGTTQLFATDAGGGYAGDTTVVTVQASVRLAASSIYINQNEQFGTQVLLSDPSPAGGTYVAFAYSTTGVASVSPDPAFIPAGQLAADIIVSGIGAGNTNITPIAAGVNGTATYFDAAVPKLNLSVATKRLGAGQYDPNDYVYTPRNVTNPLAVAFTTSDTTVVRTESNVTIPANVNYAYFTTRGLRPGTAVTIVNAAGWQPDTFSTTVTTPRIGICCGATLNTTSPIRNVTVYAEDSVGTTHYRINSLVVSLRSTDTSVIRVLDTTVTIAAGQYYNGAGRIAPAGGGSAWVIASAGGHFIDSTQYTVVGPKLNFSFYTLMFGAGQSSGVNGVYVYTPDNVTAPLTVNIVSADSGKVAANGSVTIPAGSNIAYFTVRGLATTTAPISMIASANGYTPDTGFVTVTSPRVTSCCSATLNNFSGPRAFTVYTTDSLGSTHYAISPVRFTLVSSDTNVIRIDSSAVTVAAGAYYNNTAAVRPVGIGSAKIYVTGPAGYINDSSSVYTVVTPKLNLSWINNYIGLRQSTGSNAVYVYTPDNRTDTLHVSIVQKHPERVRLIDADTSIKIPAGTNYRYFGYDGIGLGGDTIIVSATGYLPDTAFVTVTTPKFTTGNLPGTATTTTPPTSVYVQASDSLGTSHYTSDTVTVRVVSSDTNVVRPESTYVHIPKGQYYRYATVQFVGPGSASITFSDSAGLYQPVTTNTVTVTGPSLRMSTTSIKLGMRQYDPNPYVSTDNNVTGSPLVVRLLSTDPRVATVPDSVIIPVGYNYAYFRVTAQDTIGTIQVQATATGYSPVNTTVQVTQPKFLVYTPGTANTTSAPGYLDVYAADAFGTTHLVNENVTVSLVSSDPTVASPDSATVTIVAGSYYSNTASVQYGTTGTARITASDPRAVYYRYDAGFADVTIQTPTVSFSFSTDNVAIGQYLEPYVYIPDYPADTVTVTISHIGTAETTTPSVVKIPPGRNYEYFRITGNSTGIDSLIASASAHSPDTSYVNVGTGRLDPISGWPSSLAVGQVATLTLYTRDQNGNARAVENPTTFALSGTNIAFYSDAAATMPITSATVPANTSYVTFYVKGETAGSGSGTITGANYTTYSNTVTVTP